MVNRRGFLGGLLAAPTVGKEAIQQAAADVLTPDARKVFYVDLEKSPISGEALNSVAQVGKSKNFYYDFRDYLSSNKDAFLNLFSNPDFESEWKLYRLNQRKSHTEIMYRFKTWSHNVQTSSMILEMVREDIMEFFDRAEETRLFSRFVGDINISHWKYESKSVNHPAILDYLQSRPELWHELFTDMLTYYRVQRDWIDPHDHKKSWSNSFKKLATRKDMVEKEVELMKKYGRMINSSYDICRQFVENLPLKELGLEGFAKSV